MQKKQNRSKKKGKIYIKVSINANVSPCLPVSDCPNRHLCTITTLFNDNMPNVAFSACTTVSKSPKKSMIAIIEDQFYTPWP